MAFHFTCTFQQPGKQGLLMTQSVCTYLEKSRKHSSLHFPAAWPVADPRVAWETQFPSIPELYRCWCSRVELGQQPSKLQAKVCQLVANTYIKRLRKSSLTSCSLTCKLCLNSTAIPALQEQAGGQGAVVSWHVYRGSMYLQMLTD